MLIVFSILSAAIGYVLGSISFAVIVAKKKGVDIFKEGSGNPGATNVKRVLGKTAGNTVFALDAGKGALAVGVPLFIASMSGLDAAILGIAGLAGSIIGHSFSLFLKFRGGKGVAVTMGGLLVLMPLTLLAGIGMWLLVFYTTRIVAVASILFGLVLPGATILFYKESTPLVVFSILLGLLILIRHKSNIQRLLKGEENAFKKK